MSIDKKAQDDANRRLDDIMRKVALREAEEIGALRRKLKEFGKALGNPDFNKAIDQLTAKQLRDIDAAMKSASNGPIAVQGQSAGAASFIGNMAMPAGGPAINLLPAMAGASTADFNTRLKILEQKLAEIINPGTQPKKGLPIEQLPPPPPKKSKER